MSIRRLFSNRGITTDTIAFYNDPAFTKCEETDRAFLEFYAAWVRARPRSAEYDARVRSIVPRVAERLADAIERDGQRGVCIDASMMLTKMFEELGVWCYAAKGSLSITAPSLEDPTYFWVYDVEEAAGHAWVVAPPFEIIDVTLRSQPYTRGEAALLPRTVVVETGRRFTPEPHEYCSGELLMRQYQKSGALPPDVHFRMFSGLRRAAEYFPSYEVDVGSAVLRYALGGITMSDGPSLASVVSRRWNGKLAVDLFNDDIRPGLED